MRAFTMRVGSGFLGSLALVLVGCEDPPPPTPAGAFALQFLDSSGNCDPATHNAAMGVVGQEGDPDLVSSGANGAEVTCTVKPSGGGFQINADLTDGPNLQVSVPSISADNVDEASGADGSVSYVSSDTGGDVYSAGSTCKFWVNPDSQYIRAGSAWVSFVCPEIGNEGSVCSIENGFLNVKNCDGAVEEDEE
jgi:hypothetical protein